MNFEIPADRWCAAVNVCDKLRLNRRPHGKQTVAGIDLYGGSTQVVLHLLELLYKLDLT